MRLAMLSSKATYKRGTKQTNLSFMDWIYCCCFFKIIILLLLLLFCIAVVFIIFAFKDKDLRQ